MFSNEDVTIGAWMLAMNVNHENNHELCAPECTSTSIAVWDIPKCSGSDFLLHKMLIILELRSLYNNIHLDIPEKKCMKFIIHAVVPPEKIIILV